MYLHLNCVFMNCLKWKWNGIVWNGIAFDIETVFTLNWIVWNGTAFDIETVLMLNWIAWNGTVFDIETVFTLNWILWNGTVLTLNCTVWNRTDYLYEMDLALNNLQRLICHKTQTTNQPTFYSPTNLKAKIHFDGSKFDWKSATLLLP